MLWALQRSGKCETETTWHGGITQIKALATPNHPTIDHQATKLQKQSTRNAQLNGDSKSIAEGTLSYHPQQVNQPHPSAIEVMNRLLWCFIALLVSRVVYAGKSKWWPTALLSIATRVSSQGCSIMLYCAQQGICLLLGASHALHAHCLVVSASQRSCCSTR